MTRKPNFWKCILGVFVLALLFIATWATVRAPRTVAAKVSVAKTLNKSTPGSNLSTRTVPQACLTPAWDEVFEIDQNAANDTGLALTEDWNDINPANGTLVVGPAGHAGTRTFVPDPSTRDDLIYTGGSSKDFNDVSQWNNVARGTGPDKDDIQHAYAARYAVNDPTSCNNGHSVLVFGGERPTSHGDANIGFWFFQNPVFPANGQFLDCDPSLPTCTNPQPAHHEDGDIFVLSEFSGGGGQSFIRVLVWVGNSADPVAACTARGGSGIDAKSNGTLCELPVANSLKATGVTNAGNITVDWPYANKDNKTNCNNGNGTDGPTGDCTVPTPDFFEGAIDLTALGVAGECFSSFLLETRSSSEVSAVLKDFALGQFESCSGECSKGVSPADICLGQSTTYTYSVTNSGGAPISVTSVKDDNATPDDGNAGNGDETADDFFVNGLAVGGATCAKAGSAVPFTLAAGQTATCTITVTPQAAGDFTNTVVMTANSGGINVPLECNPSTATLHVHPNPTVSVSAPAVCVGSSSTITATPNPAGTYTYVWTVPAGVQDPGNVASFSASVAGSYGVTITNGNNCSGSNSATLVLNPNPTVTVNSPSVCAGFSTTITASPNPAGSYTYVWTVPAGVQNPGNVASFSASVAGNYGVTITNGNNCSGSNSGTLTVNPNPQVSIAAVSCSTSGSLNLTATVTAGSGTAPFNYVWKRNNVAFATHNAVNAFTDSVSVTETGSYTVVVTDANGCISGTATRVVGLCAP